MKTNTLDYIIIMPAKNEEEYIEKTINSILKQTCLPWKLIVVNDGSTDNTASIIRRYAKQYDFIQLVDHYSGNSTKEEGSPIVKAFYKGYDALTQNDLNREIICKIDADLIFPKHYFEEIVNTFLSDSQIGLCGGQCMHQKGNKWVQDKVASYHIRGALKSYRIKCFNEIGGFLPVLGWDGLDTMMAIRKGWKVKSLHNINVKHLRPTASDHNQLKLAIRLGEAMYKNRSTFDLMLIRCMKRITKKPYILYSFYFMWGYIKAMYRKKERNIDKDLGVFINSFHRKRILLMWK